MRLIVHAGLHKTGSTYLQHVMNDNAALLSRQGVFYEPQPGYPAHHHAAWDLLRGDGGPVTRMLGAARAAGCHTTIFSSEDLEGLIFDPQAVAALEATAAGQGVTEIEWHVCLRDPGAYFASLYAQLQHHVYADAVALLCEVLRDGMVMILDPLRGKPGTPYWCYCFDHDQYLTAFAERSPHSLVAHDFRDAKPFPGWGVLAAAGVALDGLALPDVAARNVRLPHSAVRDGFVARVLERVPDGADRGILTPLVAEHVERSLVAIDRYAALVGERFTPGMEAVLGRFGRSAPAPARRSAAA
ncbi:MAG TPA: hypothetical protein VFT56_05525 [Sphingomonas sp.]|nr:hypothetical protein [Sphingomonas sp.]